MAHGVHYEIWDIRVYLSPGTENILINAWMDFGFCFPGHARRQPPGRRRSCSWTCFDQTGHHRVHCAVPRVCVDELRSRSRLIGA
jgi:hypothetical protein